MQGEVTYEKASYSSQTFMGCIRGNEILDYSGNLIGYSVKKYQEAIDTAEGYQEALYEHGILQRPKTPEDLAKETQEELNQTKKMLAETQEQNKAILEKLDAIMGGKKNDK